MNVLKVARLGNLTKNVLEGNSAHLCQGKLSCQRVECRVIIAQVIERLKKEMVSTVKAMIKENGNGLCYLVNDNVQIDSSRIRIDATVIDSMNILGQTILAVGEFVLAPFVLAFVWVQLPGRVKYVRATCPFQSGEREREREGNERTVHWLAVVTYLVGCSECDCKHVTSGSPRKCTFLVS